MVTAAVLDFLANAVIHGNNRVLNIDLDDCNNLRNAVNNQTERVELIINQYKNKNPLLFPPLDNSIKICSDAVDCFNKAYGMVTDTINKEGWK